MAHNAGALTLDITDDEDSTSDDLIALFGSALGPTVTAAHILGQAAEKFWRGGKCIEVVATPKGGDVDANSVTEVVAKVRQRFDGNELTKPVVATLTGVKSVDPAGVKQPAPATFKYTAGAKPGAKGELKLESVSNRGIGTTTVTFTVKAGKWTTGSTATFGQGRGAKCNGIGGTWTVRGHEIVDVVELTTLWTVTIDPTTLAGTYSLNKTQEIKSAQSVVTGTSTGKARIVVNEDGSVLMTWDAAPITLETTTPYGTATVVVPGTGGKFLWLVDATAVCP
jgi:hypothetical protein